ncbi:MAG: CBS domain-containing protein [Anaerolineaceae bacterium]|nr:CBS domain-containing protein [Anaerolineaceae bacterium]
MFTTVRDLLRVKGDQVWTIAPETTVFSTIQILAERDVGALLILEDDQIAGIISERDIVRQIALEEALYLNRQVVTLMTREVITISPDAGIEECMQMMTEEHIRHLPVVEAGQLVGLVSIGDVVKAIISQHEYTIEQLSKYIDGAYNQ